MRLLAVADWDEVNAKARLGFRGWGLEMPRHETEPAMHRALFEFGGFPDSPKPWMI